ncbi:hypothetical protein [Pseudomonas sp. 18173]|uniref:hypothetical protein n=1 Tax=Pseudomonas sp. 18173 TaxID=3390055 RepID=UPI003D24B395
MLGYIFEVIKDEISYRRERARRAALPPPALETKSSPATPSLGMRILSPPPRPAPSMPPLKNWSHPFGDRGNPLQQLTQLANAQAGYYPLGRNGMWHGGVHFDSGTTGPDALTQVRCLADGEVVAYRVPERTPLSTFYPEAGGTLEAPFASGFVLVRHHLQAPKMDGSSDEPPGLTFYSLYMHLEDWTRYEADPTLQRPAFWPERNLRVRKDVSNSRPGTSVPRGLETLTRPAEDGHMLDLLPPGTPVVVSGEGKYRKLEHTRGPALLLDSDGSLQGYVAFRFLDHVSGTTYRVSFNGDKLRVRPTPDLRHKKLFELRWGTEVTISGEGEFRKLESISQYVLAASLQGERAADTGGNVVVLDQPIPIKAGELIGHLGPYQECDETAPQQKLHLEVFSDDDVEAFFAASRAWAQRLPDKHNTWLKLAKGTTVAAHQDHISASLLPIWSRDNPRSDADLLVPKSLLDSLPSERKIRVPNGASGKTYNWYRLEGLIHDTDGKPLDGWVREEVGVTPWVSPWSWDGYDVLYNYALPQLSLSYLFSVTGVLGEESQDRLRARAEKWDKGRMQTRLYEIIDRDRNGQMTADELQAALRMPAKAQALAQLVIFSENEWNYRQSKWDALDEVLGHTSSAPILNWVAEKQRLKQLSWWGEVAGKVGLSKEGMVFHFHPIGLAANFPVKDECPCGCCFGAKFLSTRYGQQYGPVYWGKTKLADFKDWDNLVRNGAVTIAERTILVAMSENEGNLDALQSYDSEILTAGAMQKTINLQGAGELSQQVYEFKQEHPDLYQSLFMDCGWEVKTQNGKNYLYYDGVTGSELKALLRDGFDQAAYQSKEKLTSKPLAAFAHAIIAHEYVVKQVLDFARRLRMSMSISPAGYQSRTISNYICSNFGKALVLDHHVNRPGYVSSDFGTALTVFFNKNPAVSENPANWGSDHAKNESALLEIYGSSRRMTDAYLRYQNLRSKL